MITFSKKLSSIVIAVINFTTKNNVSTNSIQKKKKKETRKKIGVTRVGAIFFFSFFSLPFHKTFFTSFRKQFKCYSSVHHPPETRIPTMYSPIFPTVRRAANEHFFKLPNGNNWTLLLSTSVIYSLYVFRREFHFHSRALFFFFFFFRPTSRRCSSATSSFRLSPLNTHRGVNCSRNWRNKNKQKNSHKQCNNKKKKEGVSSIYAPY